MEFFINTILGLIGVFGISFIFAVVAITVEAALKRRHFKSAIKRRQSDRFHLSWYR